MFLSIGTEIRMTKKRLKITAKQTKLNTRKKRKIKKNQNLTSILGVLHICHHTALFGLKFFVDECIVPCISNWKCTRSVHPLLEWHLCTCWLYIWSLPVHNNMMMNKVAFLVDQTRNMLPKVTRKQPTSVTKKYKT